MINRENWKFYKAFLEYREKIDQICIGSLRTEKTYLRYLLEWADSVSFRKAHKIRPTFQDYLLSVRLDGSHEQLSPSYTKKTLSTARNFFLWCADNYSGFNSIKRAWINALKPRRVSAPPKEKESVSLDEILAIAAAPAENITERRIRAAAVFWYLSGIRIGAFVSLPIKAVNIGKREIKQYPDFGVRTKNGKFAVTYLLDIPELLAVVQEWDLEIRSCLPGEGFWFAPLSPDTGEIDPTIQEIGEHRHNLARRNLITWLQKVGLPYHSPHKFRHGHIQYGLSHAETLADYKAVSMNVMHSNMEITDEIYSRLGDHEIRSRIDALGKEKISSQDADLEDTFLLFQEFLTWRKTIK